MCLGNITPAAEFNIYVDPHAANIVLASGIPLTMMGLDVTHKVNVNEEIIRSIVSNNNKSSNFFRALSTLFLSILKPQIIENISFIVSLIRFAFS